MARKWRNKFLHLPSFLARIKNLNILFSFKFKYNYKNKLGLENLANLASPIVNPRQTGVLSMCSYRTQTCLIFSDTNSKICVIIHCLTWQKTLTASLVPQVCQNEMHHIWSQQFIGRKIVLAPGQKQGLVHRSPACEGVIPLELIVLTI